MRSLRTAGRSRRRPEREHDRVAAKLAQTHVFAFQRCQSEIRRLLALQRGDELPFLRADASTDASDQANNSQAYSFHDVLHEIQSPARHPSSEDSNPRRSQWIIVRQYRLVATSALVGEGLRLVLARRDAKGCCGGSLKKRYVSKRLRIQAMEPRPSAPNQTAPGNGIGAVVSRSWEESSPSAMGGCSVWTQPSPPRF